MSFDFEHLKKLCVCKRTTKGFDYGETHPNLGKCGVGQRWSGVRENIELAEKEYKDLESQLSEANKKLEEAVKAIKFAVQKIESSSTGYNDYALEALKKITQ